MGLWEKIKDYIRENWFIQMLKIYAGYLIILWLLSLFIGTVPYEMFEWADKYGWILIAIPVLYFYFKDDNGNKNESN